MSKLQVPVNCGGLTTTTSGAQVPTAAKLTVTAAEITTIVQDYNKPRVVSSNLSTGAVVVKMAPTITSITMNGNVYAVTAGVSAAMAAVDATQLINESFKLVTG
jgi:hypothetical protein